MYILHILKKTPNYQNNKTPQQQQKIPQLKKPKNQHINLLPARASNVNIHCATSVKIWFIQGGPSPYPKTLRPPAAVGAEAHIGEYTDHGMPNAFATAAALFISLSLPLEILNMFKY